MFSPQVFGPALMMRSKFGAVRLAAAHPEHELIDYVTHHTPQCRGCKRNLDSWIYMGWQSWDDVDNEERWGAGVDNPKKCTGRDWGMGSSTI